MSKATQIADFFVETLIAGAKPDSEVGDLTGIISPFSNAKTLTKLAPTKPDWFAVTA